MIANLKKIIVLFSVLALFTVACGKPEHNNNQINQAQQQQPNSNQNQMNQ